ncbi:Protein kinase superfamily protein [Zea mays]|uniref:non-specific serine/threonine protein kinase n=1 Tax=Zea mays TaxID=4577 RepID=A0A1D6KH11_MAIZE|nr:Protein kinase superfamily protein [Zea mays]ONM02382.1 Protein kinase superfamily protein [Zea mays]
MAAGGEPSPLSPAKYSRLPDDAQPDASPKRRKRHHRHHHHHHHRRHRHADSPIPEAADEEVEEGEILDDASSVSAMEVNAESAAPQSSLAPEHFGNGADINTDATKMQAPAPPTLPSSKDRRRSLHGAPESESGGILSSDAEDNKGHGRRQSQSCSKSPKPRREKERRHKDGHHSSSSKDHYPKNRSRASPYSRHQSEAHSRDHLRSGERGDDTNGSDRESNDQNGKSGRHTTGTQENERERSSSHGIHDRHGDRHNDRHGSQERYRDDRTYRDKIDSLEATWKHRERSRSHSRSDLRESTRLRDQSRESERRIGSSMHRDHGSKRDTSKHRESDRVNSAYERERGRDAGDREWHRVKGSETHRAKEGRDKVSDSDRYRDSTRSKYSVSDGYKERTRSGEKGRDVDRKNRKFEEMKENYLKEEDEEKYQEKIEQQLAMQEEEDPEKIKEEARRRKEAIMAKYRQQQSQKQDMEAKPSSNDEEVRAMDGNVTMHQKDDNGSSSTGNDKAENKHDSSEVFDGKTDFSVGKSPAQNDTSTSTGAFTDERTIDVSGLGEGSPKSERSADMFCDDIFGESPAGVRKSGKGDGLHVERNALHDNWDDADGYYTYRFGELLDGHYEIIAAHGKGVFSKVVRAKDLKASKDDPEEVAIKIIRNKETMYKAGKQEVSILEKLASVDREDKRHCVRFISSFMYRNHLCLVFESLNMNLREVLKKFGRNIGLKLTAVRAYSKQLFIALKHLKNCKVLHCDIKPDNMLLRLILLAVSIGHLRSVSSFILQFLGLAYDHPLDMWSVGCCLYELYTGKVLFPGPSNNAMLRLHMELKGPFPKKMLRKGAFTMQHFDQDLNFHATEEDPVTKTAVRRLILNIKPKDVGFLILNSPGEDPKMLSSFKDLLDKMFILDPEKRITVSQALSHPFITGK